MEYSRDQEKEVEVKRMTDEIKNKCYSGIRGVYTTKACIQFKHVFSSDHTMKW